MRVRFTANRDFALTRGTVYTVLNHDTQRNRYAIRNDNDVVGNYATNLFEIVDGAETPNQPQPVQAENAPRRRGRPTNAEIAARNAQQNTNNAAEERARREQEQRRAEEQRQAEARRQQEQQRQAERNRVRTEREIIDTIRINVDNRTDVPNGRGMALQINNIITLDVKETQGANTQLSTIQNNLVLSTNQPYSCGIIQLNNVESVLNQIITAIPYDRNDYEVLTKRLVSDIFEEQVRNALSAINNRAGIVTMSITTRNPRHLSLILENTDFREVTRAVNGNSNNTIVILNKVLRPVN